MQIVSDNAKTLLSKHAKITITAYLDGEKMDAGIGAFSFQPSCGDDQEFSFGNACATGVNLTLAASLPGLKGHNLDLTWAVDETEYPLFSGRIEKNTVTAGRTAVEAWDAMYYGGSDAFIPSPTLEADVDAAVAFQSIATAIGVETSEDALTILSGITITGGLAHLAEEYSNSAVVGCIAGLVGGNALIDRSGLLTVRQYTFVDFVTEPYMGGAIAQNSDFVVTGITLQREQTVVLINEDDTTSEEQQVLEYYAGDGTTMVANPLADQNAADRVYAALESLSFRPGSYSFPGGLLLEPGDLFTVHSMDGSYTVAAVMLLMSFDGGVKTTVSCGGEMPKGGAQGSINQALATLVADFARLRTLVAENARIVNARISNLTVDDIIAGKIHSTDFATVALQELYPSADLYPSDATYPNNGEQIVRGFEIDFSSGIIRGVFWSEAMDALTQRVERLEEKYADLEMRLSSLEQT